MSAVEEAFRPSFSSSRVTAKPWASPRTRKAEIALPTVVETTVVALVLLPLLRRLFPYRMRLDGYAVIAA